VEGKAGAHHPRADDNGIVSLSHMRFPFFNHEGHKVHEGKSKGKIRANQCNPWLKFWLSEL